MEICKCGHPSSEHEVVRDGSGREVCFHDDDPNGPDNSTMCECMEFTPAETAEVAAEAGA